MLKRLLRKDRVSPAFVTSTEQKPRLVIDYSTVKKSLEERMFRIDQLGDIEAVLRPKDSLFKAKVTDA